ncbi:MAG: ThiF family adenylyltransferase [Ktedonobacteraceae bacterium]|nr:ThiF family adenylyltransferase [Ktedonobacteraceae bacterium]
MIQPLNPNSPFFHEERHATLAPLAEKLIAVCGAGALGGTLTETLTRMGFRRLKLIDRDRVETRNLSTQPYSRAEVGAPKARALANSLYRAVQARIEPIVNELNSANAEQLLKESALIVDAFDNRAARAAVSEAALKLELPCLHIGFSADGLYGSGQWEPGYQVPRETAGDPCDYPLTRPFAVTLSALAARSIIDFLRDGTASNFELTWNDLKISSY